VDGITVHPRTRSQRFGGRAPWDVIAAVVAAVDSPVTGNGDVASLAEARAMIASTGCESVMVGRAALGRPWIFDAAYEGLTGEARADYEARTIGEHLDLIEEYFPPREALLQMKKHLAHYGAGREAARTLRAELFAQTSIPALRTAYAVQATAGGGIAAAR
jgi:tRNA-dihydrouridine synthase B